MSNHLVLITTPWNRYGSHMILTFVKGDIYHWGWSELCLGKKLKGKNKVFISQHQRDGPEDPAS
jgi:hypothetical protein